MWRQPGNCVIIQHYQSGNSIWVSVDTAVMDDMADHLGVHRHRSQMRRCQSYGCTAGYSQCWIWGSWCWPRLYLGVSIQVACLIGHQCSLRCWDEIGYILIQVELIQWGWNRWEEISLWVSLVTCLWSRLFRMFTWTSLFAATAVKWLEKSHFYQPGGPLSSLS